RRGQESLLPGHRRLGCGDQPDAAMAELYQVVDRGRHALRVVRDDREIVARARRAVAKDERELLAAQLGDRRVGGRAGRDENAVDPPLLENAQVARLALERVVGVAEDQVVAA